jgi:hypothetical protein
MLTRTDIEKYFIAEKQESLLLLILGLAFMVLALVFYFGMKTQFFRGAAFPLLLFGLIQAVIGFTIHQRSDPQRVSNVYAYDMHPGQLKNVELPRMEKLNRSFIIYRWIEIAGLAAGLLLASICYSDPSRHFWLGFGLALALMAAVLYVADLSASKRAVRYTNGLKAFSAGA